MRRSFWVAGSVLVLAGLGAAFFSERHELRLRYRVWRIRSPDDLAKRLEGLTNEESLELLEAVAFDVAPADSWTRPLRQKALDEVRRRKEDPRTGSGPSLTDAELARALRGARGLERGWTLFALYECDSRSAALRDAAFESVGDEDATTEACQYLVRCWSDRESLPAWRRTASSCPDSWVRACALWQLVKFHDPEAVPLLVRALHDPHPGTRLSAAEALLEVYGEQAGAQGLVDSLLDHPELAAPILARLDERRAVLELCRTHDLRNGNDRGALERITGVKLDLHASWTAWFEQHRAEFPPQLEAHRR